MEGFNRYKSAEASEAGASKEQLDEADEFIGALGIASDEATRLALAKDLASMIAHGETILENAPIGLRHASRLVAGGELIGVLSAQTGEEVSRRLVYGRLQETERRIARFMQHNDPIDE